MIIPIDGWNLVAENVLRFALLLSDDVTAVHVSADNDDMQRMMDIWAKKIETPAAAANSAIPHLVVIYSPHRRIYKHILDFVDKVEKEKPDRIVAVVIPELVEPHRYEYLLYNAHAAALRTLLFLERDRRTVVITTPWYLR